MPRILAPIAALSLIASPALAGTATKTTTHRIHRVAKKPMVKTVAKSTTTTTTK